MHRLKPIKNGFIGLIGLAAAIAATLLSSTFARAADDIQLKGVMIRPQSGNGLCLNMSGGPAVKCDPSDEDQRADIGTFGSSPAPTPTPTPTPGGTVPLTLTTSSVTDGYQSAAIGSLLLSNNTWGVRNIPSGSWSQAVGMTRSASGGVDFRFKWDFSRISCPKCDVISYPEVIYGRSASFERTAGSAIPRRISELQELTTSYERVELGNMVKASHLAYDLWTSRSPDNLSRANRLAEIMLAEVPNNGYGVPNWGPAAADRSGPATGRNSAGYKGRHTIGGDVYDVYFSPPSNPGLAWNFIVFEPVRFRGTGPSARDWLPLLNFCADRGWIGRNDWLNAVELGVEPAYQGSAGDLTVRGYQVNAK